MLCTAVSVCLLLLCIVLDTYDDSLSLPYTHKDTTDTLVSTVTLDTLRGDPGGDVSININNH